MGKGSAVMKVMKGKGMKTLAVMKGSMKKAVVKKAAMKKTATKKKKWTKMTPTEMRLAKTWFEKNKLAPSEIAARLGRDKSVMTRLLVKQVPRKKQGRNAKLSKADVDALERRLDDMIVAADTKYHVTGLMLKKAANSKASVKTIQKALRQRGIYFRKLREKPLLTPDDIKDRFKFGKKNKDKPLSFWKKMTYIDGKNFKTYLTAKTRKLAAQHRTWGAYRKPGKGLSGGYVKPKRGMNFNTGSKSSLVIGGIGAGKMVMWYEVSKGLWSGQAAADMYKKGLRPALDAKWPKKQTSYTILEDNDPTGFKSTKGEAAKEEAKLEVFRIPKRSPDLSPMDFAIWPEINKRMRNQEKNWPGSKRETRANYLKRLRRTAMRLPARLIDKTIRDMKRRCQKVYDAKGGFFEEGGRE